MNIFFSKTAGKLSKTSEDETEAATQSLMGLEPVASTDVAHDKLVPGPPITMSDQGFPTVSQTVPGEIPAKAVSSAQDGSKKKMTFVVPKGKYSSLLLFYVIELKGYS